MQPQLSNDFAITSIALYRPGCTQPQRLYGDWTIQELSIVYPVSITTGVDTLLYGIPDHQHDAVIIEFVDNLGQVLPYDPRVFLEDTDLLIGS